jgi:hypothetical protein
MPRYGRGGTGAKRKFCTIYTLKRTFYQDRLGTNIGKTQTKMAFRIGWVRLGLELCLQA